MISLQETLFDLTEYSLECDEKKANDNGNCSCSKCGKLIKQPADQKPEDYL